MSQIILIRPGCTEFDEQQRIQGNLDLPLSPGGRQQVERLLKELEHVKIDYLFSSPCEPARSTAEAISLARGLNLREVEGLHNVNHGLWQGLKIEDIRRKHPKVFKQWQESPEAICPPEGELLSEAIARVKKALEKPLKKKGNLAFVAADPLATIICAVVQGLPLETIPAVCDGACGSWQYLKENDRKTPSGEFSLSDLLHVGLPRTAAVKN
ncbi:MAG: histidine phosphatase family protein [Planctomycetes bacterium]|nr:histidine phosphatase family protein [Planctomycetota bacterium]